MKAKKAGKKEAAALETVDAAPAQSITLPGGAEHKKTVDARKSLKAMKSCIRLKIKSTSIIQWNCL
jgi:hypothetical protein